ncbi:hypothetical protein E0E05_09565 [Roseitalea porphyridii]|uniref:Stress response protein n=1 Tax=Roseitalea porphyridii TaxID=1852022 RepID=A0A4P6V0I6_9HYPH|nr:hypothetical protein E0E05_09565 [Roseitalea porphyridii]
MGETMRPEYLSQGEEARLFPVLSTTSKEGRTTSIVLACLSLVDEFAQALLKTVSQRPGKRTKIECFTEVVFKGQKRAKVERPDGLIVLTTGPRVWKALVEAKVGNTKINPEQIEKYRTIAKDFGADCVITISNQFATRPDHHPDDAVRKQRSKIPVFHWSWMKILTECDLLISNETVQDSEQLLLMKELRRFLTHESAGVRGFDRMPPEWSAVNKLISNGGKLPARSHEAEIVIDAWHQETKDLSLILSRQTETAVTERLSRKHSKDPTQRRKDELALLREQCQLRAELQIENAAAPIQVTADLARRTVDVGMSLRAPDDRKSAKARLNWLLRQIRGEASDDLHIRLNWPGRSDPTQFPYTELVQDPAIVEEGKEGLTVYSFDVFLSKRLGARFIQQTNFISELESLVPDFYRKVGQNLTAWQMKPPKIREEKKEAEDVSVEAIAELERPEPG